MKKNLKISLIIFLVMFQLFSLNVRAYEEDKTDINHKDTFKLNDKNKVFSSETNMAKLVCKYGLVGILNKKIMNPITVTTIGYELILLKSNYSNRIPFSRYEEVGMLEKVDMSEEVDILEKVDMSEEVDMLEETDILEENTIVGKTESILALVKDSIIYAEVIENTDYYQYQGSGLLGTIPKGTTVEILRDYSTVWYKIKLEEKEVWVRGAALKIPEDPETNTHRMTKEEIEFYVNHIELSSVTNYLVWVDIDRQLVHVFLGAQGKWGLHKTMPCATGKNKSPTLRGLYEIQERGSWFYSQRLGGGAKNWVRFSGDYLFHSITMNINQNIVNPTLGKRLSAGCIRLSLEDSGWFYGYVQQGTTVYIN